MVLTNKQIIFERAGHSKGHGPGGDQVAGVGELGSDAVDVVVVQEGQQVPALVQGPLFRAELPCQGVADLEHIHGVEGGPPWRWT